MNGEIPPPIEHIDDDAAGARSEEIKEEIKAEFARANEDRDYSIYTRSMDAALAAKASSIFPHFTIEEGDVIVDAGSGTGAMAERAGREFRGAQVYALDISHELMNLASEQQALINLVYGDAREQNFPENSVKIKYFSTSGHEIESFGGPGSMRTAAKNTFKELAPGGRIVIRDFAKPSRTEPVYMQILSKIGLDYPPEGTPENEIDYNVLSTLALLERFRAEFGGGNEFSYELENIGGEDYIKISPEWAHEFYLRKDYTANWRQEIKEKYTFWTPQEARQIFEAEGYTNVQVIPDPNKYILENRLNGKVALFEMRDGQLQPMPFPPTHMVVTGEKPSTKQVSAAETKPKAIDYQELLSAIEVDEEKGLVRVGDREFQVQPTPIIGSKKRIFQLADKPQVLKVPREDARNLHEVFKSLFQIIDRQEVLEQFSTPHLEIVDSDPEGPPYRFVVQQSAPEDALSAAELIMNGQLTEDDIRQIAEIANKYEESKQWQLDTNPHSWFKVRNEDGSTQLTYASGKVYRYDERWAFGRIGLLQWIDPQYVKMAEDFSAAIPTQKEYEALVQRWPEPDPTLEPWKKYLSAEVQPRSQS